MRRSWKSSRWHQSYGSTESLSHTSSCQLFSPQRPCGSQSAPDVEKKCHFVCHTQWRDGYFDFSIVIYKGDKWPRDPACGCHKKYSGFRSDLIRVFTICLQRDLYSTIRLYSVNLTCCYSNIDFHNSIRNQIIMPYSGEYNNILFTWQTDERR